MPKCGKDKCKPVCDPFFFPGIPGATGATGATGVGETGATGATGAVGETGATGAVGATGAAGLAGLILLEFSSGIVGATASAEFPLVGGNSFVMADGSNSAANPGIVTSPPDTFILHSFSKRIPVGGTIISEYISLLYNVDVADAAGILVSFNVQVGTNAPPAAPTYSSTVITAFVMPTNVVGPRNAVFQGAAAIAVTAGQLITIEIAVLSSNTAAVISNLSASGGLALQQV